MFCLIVFTGSIRPQFVFNKCTPIVLAYTIMYAAARYSYASVIQLFPDLHADRTADEIGLSGMEAFDYGWLPATSLVFSVFTLSLLIRLKRDFSGGAGGGSELVVPQADSQTTNLLLEFERRDGLRLTCLFLSYYMGVADASLLCAPFLFFFWIFTSLRKKSRKLFIVLVLYTDLFILVQYFWEFSLMDKLSETAMIQKHMDDIGLHNTREETTTERWQLVTTLLVPFVLHMLCIRQLRVDALKSNNQLEYKGSFAEAPILVRVGMFVAPVIFFMLLSNVAFSTPLSAITGG